MRGPVPPILIYIHVLLHRLGVIAGNHFNGPYRVTEGVWFSMNQRYLVECYEVCVSYRTGLAQYSSFAPSKFTSLTNAFLFAFMASLEIPAFTICLCDL